MWDAAAVKLRINDTIITSVVFGSVDYPVDSQAAFDITGNSVILFDKATGDNVAIGRLEF